MTNVFLIALLICHLIGDFYLQSQSLAKSKQACTAKMLTHCLLYSIPFAALLTVATITMGISHELALATLIVVGIVTTHATIDILKCRLLDKWPASDKHNATFFALDQSLHIALIIAATVLAEVAFPNASPVAILPAPLLFWQAALFALALVKPTNIVFRIMFERFGKDVDTPTDKSELPTEEGAGALIGAFERLIMGTFIFFGQFAAMGLVVAAKTLTRFNRISKSPRFAEYYLIGTLFSVLAVIVLYLLIFGLPQSIG